MSVTPRRIVDIYIRFCPIDSLKGGPTLSTMPDKMYSKHDTKKSVVFSEFSIFDFSLSRWGGMNLCGSALYDWYLVVTYHGCLLTAWNATA
jgi:hypothetical protein